MAVFKVLVVDDDYINRKLLVNILKKKLYEIETLESADGEDALDKLHQNPDIELILLDIEMPKVNGIEFLARYMDDDTIPRVPIIAISSNETREKESLIRGADAFLVKPISEERLMEAICSSC
ncbi:response regulator [Sulfurovum sp. bin170]|uniref:response regulator n=1 Tax=Sulfurovum sp. bin170 TaxID=2695268 RepID=UPI0013DFD9F9|nr:response regulator [Sulfurovum sp. bin170]NEW61716.1 response regulator [Sulfurovum sp. bin170]